MARYTMTPARRAALQRAQAISAAKRRGKGKGKLAAANRKLGTKRGVSKRRKIIGSALIVGGYASLGVAAYKSNQSVKLAKMKYAQK